MAKRKPYPGDYTSPYKSKKTVGLSWMLLLLETVDIFTWLLHLFLSFPAVVLQLWRERERDKFLESRLETFTSSSLFIFSFGRIQVATTLLHPSL